jgi:hypothetical protein
MVFDKNQAVFPSAFCRDVWWWAVGIVPLANSLTDEVKNQCTPDILDGCSQWHDYFNELCVDMYNHECEYLPLTARQYRDVLESVSAGGRIRDDNMVWDAGDWESYVKRCDKSKAYVTAGVSLNQCLEALKRTGLRREYADGCVVFIQDKYPKIFHAMHIMEQSPGVRNTPVRHHFAHCEFRQLYKSYSANYDELLRRVSVESLNIAHSIHDFCKSAKIQRYIHFDTIKYKYKGIRVVDFSLHGDMYPTLRVNVGTCAKPGADIRRDEFYKTLLGQPCSVHKTFIDNLSRCDIQEHTRYPLVIDGREERICPCSKIKIHPSQKDMDAVLAFISARKASIDQYY